MRLAGVLIGANLSLCWLPVFAQHTDLGSGNDLYDSCKAAISAAAKPRDVDEFKVGYCIGALNAVSLPPCVPEKVTIGQMIAVAIKFMDDHPEQRQQKLPRLLTDALKTAWPCTRNRMNR